VEAPDGELTNDHLPPDGFFPDPKPNNLITVRACYKCNSGAAKDDEAFRLWVSSSAFRSAAGDKIWETKVIPSFQTRNRKLAQNIQPFLTERLVKTPYGRRQTPIFSIPELRAKKFLTRLTKGLLHKFEPEYDYSSDEFLMLNVLPTPEGIATVTELVGMLIHDSRGQGVFDFCRGFTVEPENKRGVWVYFFYQGACLVVFHGPRGSFPSIPLVMPLEARIDRLTPVSKKLPFVLLPLSSK
jgi:hypothetical protein